MAGLLACGGSPGEETTDAAATTAGPEGGPQGSGEPTTGGPTAMTTGGPQGSDDDGTGTTGPDATTGDTGDPEALGGPLRRGINFGFRNPSFGDPDMAWLAVEAGCDSARLSLPETHLTTWGYEIEVGDMAAYAGLGMGRHVAFLISPIAAHSTAPDGTPDWELAHHIPKNLYLPAVVDGAPNPENYWASYVYQTVATYKDHVAYWEVWNEPDWVADYAFTQTWDQQPPTAEQLVRFGGSVFDYVRMLRVTREAARLADPDAQIALGGIGYPGFLDALLRYTDNPDGGAVTPEFPETGAAYFDVLNYHYYPLWTPGSSDAAVDGFMALRDQMAAKMSAAGAAPRPFHATEVGAPRSAYGDQPGGVEYARNVYAKVMTRAQAEGFVGVDWFSLSDGDPGDAFAEMGLYFDVKDLAAKEDGVRTPTGVAARTHGLLLGGALADPAGTAALAAGPEVRAYAFRREDDRRAIVLWAVATGADEAAQASFELASDVGFDLHHWDFGATGQSTPLAPEDGVIAVELTASPVILVQQP